MMEAMGKVSAEDKMRIQTLRKQGLGYRVIAAEYPQNNGTWIRWRRFANVLTKRDLPSSENQEAVDPKLSVLQKALKMLAKLSVHRTISQEQVKVTER